VKANWGRLVESTDSQDVYLGVRKRAGGLEPVVVIDLFAEHIGQANRAFMKERGDAVQQFGHSTFIMSRSVWQQKALRSTQ
jgi:hypothetical protein